MILLVGVVAAIWLAIIYLFSSGASVMFEDWDSSSEPGAGGRPAPYGSSSSDPAWSPDGASIAYVSTTTKDDFTGFPHPKSSVCVMDAQGQNKRRLFELEEEGEGAFSALIHSLVWLPNGQLVYGRDDGLVALSLDGTEQAWHGLDRSPAISPDGNQVADVSGPESGPAIYIGELDGSSRRFIAEGREPTWSPDALRLALVHEGGIHVINIDGTSLYRIADGDGEPAWSPDGTRIAFTRTWSSGIVVANVDGSGEEYLTTDNDSDPDWSPDGSTIAFERNDRIYVQMLGEPRAKPLTTGLGVCGGS